MACDNRSYRACNEFIETINNTHTTIIGSVAEK